LLLRLHGALCLRLLRLLRWLCLMRHARVRLLEGRRGSETARPLRLLLHLHRHGHHRVGREGAAAAGVGPHRRRHHHHHHRLESGPPGKGRVGLWLLGLALLLLLGRPWLLLRLGRESQRGRLWRGT